jgi:hypothetical protein
MGELPWDQIATATALAGTTSSTSVAWRGNFLSNLKLALALKSRRYRPGVAESVARRS